MEIETGNGNGNRNGTVVNWKYGNGKINVDGK